MKMNFTDKARFQRQHRGGPAPTGPVEGEGGRRGRGSPFESGLELGKGRAIDIQGPEWSPVPPGTKGRGKKGSERCLAPRCAGAVAEPRVCRGKRWCSLGAPGWAEAARALGPLCVCVQGRGPTPYFSSFQKGTWLDLVGHFGLEMIFAGEIPHSRQGF